MKRKKPQPHEVDKAMDVLNVLGIESQETLVLHRYRNGAVVTRPLTWAEMGLEIIPRSAADPSTP